jgi:hypothetical protein
MQRKLSELDLQSVVLLKFLDTPGDEVAPGSNKIGKDFQYEWFGHDCLLLKWFKDQGSMFKVKVLRTVQVIQNVQVVQIVGALFRGRGAACCAQFVSSSTIDSRVVGGGKSKGFWKFGAV